MSKGLWSFLFFLSGGLLLFYSILAGPPLWKYLQFSTAVQGKILELDPLPKGGKYALEATYSYMFRGKNFLGKDLFPKPYYLNRFSAEKQCQKLKEMPWEIFLNPKHPDHSSLYRLFPWKRVINTLSVLGIFFYFAYLKLHLALLERTR